MGYISPFDNFDHSAISEPSPAERGSSDDQLAMVVSKGMHLDPDYECSICFNNAFPCGCFKTPAMEAETDRAIRDYIKGRFSVYDYYERGKLCIFGPADNPTISRWGVDKDDCDRKKRIPLPSPQQELYQELMKQRLYTLKLKLD